MSKPESHSGAERCREAATKTLWSQWSVIGGQVGGRVREAAALVDPEALLLFSCALRGYEPRLWDLVGGLVAEAPSLLSVQRTRNLAAQFPASVRNVLAEVASIAVNDGKDARWRPLVGTAVARAYRAKKVFEPTRHVTETAALTLRLRLAFGVHARTDALAFLLAIAPSSATAKEIAEATGYGEMPVRRGLDAIASARIIDADGTRPTQYHAVPANWRSLLGTGNGRLVWHHWHSLFAFLAHSFELGDQASQKKRSPYLESSEARRMVVAHRAAFDLNRIVIPEPDDYPGEHYLAAFDETLGVTADWLEENV